MGREHEKCQMCREEMFKYVINDETIDKYELFIYNILTQDVFLEDLPILKYFFIEIFFAKYNSPQTRI